MKIFIQIVVIVMILAAGVYVGQKLWHQPAATANTKQGHGHGHGTVPGEHQQAMASGPHGGRLLQQNDLRLEITVYEKGVPPEFRVYAWHAGKLLEPKTLDLKMQLHRLGDEVDRIDFRSRDQYKVSNQTVTEPHSFDVKVTAEYRDEEYEWHYAQHEGRVTIPQKMAREAGIKTARVASAEIHETIKLQGRVKYDRGRLRQVRARYPGVIQSAPKRVGDRIKKNEVLARVESNDSLQIYEVRAPINGVIVEQHAGSGEAINEQTIYTIANLSEVWIDLAVFPRNWSRIEKDQTVRIQSLSEELNASATIDYLLPTSDAHSQSGTARIYLSNEKDRWRPGMAVTATVTVDKTEVPLAVRNSALQTFRDFDVVYARYGDTYEVRMLKLGQEDAEHTEVLSGIEAGTEYVVENSYVIKADIEKSGASHAH